MSNTDLTHHIISTFQTQVPPTFLITNLPPSLTLKLVDVAKLAQATCITTATHAQHDLHWTRWLKFMQKIHNSNIVYGFFYELLCLNVRVKIICLNFRVTMS